MNPPNPDLPPVFPTVVHLLADAAARAPHAPALVCGGTRLDYEAYRHAVAAFAQELRAFGVAGERVALLCGNSAEMPIAMFAAHAAGAQVVPVNPAYTARELGEILADAAPRVLVHDGTAAVALAAVAPQLAGLRVVEVGAARSLARPGAAAVALPPMPDPAALATLQYTGGTTGRPKGVQITHRQLAVNIAQREAALPTVAGDERVLCVMPLFHVFAVSMALHLAAGARGALVILPRFQPDAVFDAIERERITRLPAGPTMFIGLMAHERFARCDFSSLRCAWSGSAPLPVAALERWQAATGTPVLEGYGQTEAGPVLSYQRPEGPRVPGSVGTALPLTEIQVVDVETGEQVLPPGRLGEIRARGPQLMSGYRGRPAETAAALRGGWLYTGDIGELDADGRLFIRDRKKDMAIVGGYNVYPREVDEVLHAHPAVREAAALGVPDAYYGEVIQAWVALHDGAPADAEALLAHCRANLARYKVPARIHLVPALPRTGVGKVDRPALRAGLASS